MQSVRFLQINLAKLKTFIVVSMIVTKQDKKNIIKRNTTPLNSM